MVRDHEEESKHSVKLKDGSLIHRLVGENALRAVSVHKYHIFLPAQHVTVTGTAEDGTIEVIEHGDNLLGVQFHPEADEKLLSLFRWLCE
jgi:putative glutamine amidotransferase